LQSEIEFIVSEYTSYNISDDTMTLWLRAVFENGMNHKETLNYTQSMLHSGVTLDFSHLNGYVMDKHSTGGVGDKVSLILGPILAACDCYVPMLAGRGLEHTGGTIDKLESIPGYQTSLGVPEFQKIVEDIGISIMSQTKDICPADQKIYSLRDITETVSSFPLICGSIMSKKIAEGIQELVMDIKVGNGAFMHTLSKAKELGDLLRRVGEYYGIHVSTCYTNMDQPLGETAGLWCEVMESIKCLQGDGAHDIMKVVFHLGEKALCSAGISDPVRTMQSVIEDGSALERFKKMVKAHGGSLDSLKDSEMNKPLFSQKVQAKTNGYISYMDTLRLGSAIVQLGGGRLQKREKLDPTAGIIFYKKTGDFVNKDESFLEYFCSNKDKIERCKLYFMEIIDINSTKPEPLELIYT